MYHEDKDHDSKPRRIADAIDSDCHAFAERLMSGKLDTDLPALEWIGEVICTELMADDEFCKSAVRALIESGDKIVTAGLYKAAYDHERKEIEG